MLARDGCGGLRVLVGGQLCSAPAPWQGPECLLVVGGLFFDVVDYNLPHVWPLVGLGLDELLINRDICCCL